jgi:5-(carboxyamino)imidazole ribonucleotide synthase
VERSEPVGASERRGRDGRCRTAGADDHQAAVSLGVELRVLAGSPIEPAVAAGARALIGDNSARNLRELASGAAVLTFDHEGFDPGMLTQLEGAGLHMAPSPAAVLLAQDKLVARESLSRLGYPLPPFAVAESIEDFDGFAADHGWPLVAKTARGGYDGGGVFVLDDRAAAADLLARRPGTLILEPLLTIHREFAVQAARSVTGEIALYPAVETIQVDAICHEILVPGSLPEEVRFLGGEITRRLVEEIGATGIVAVEFFLTDDGVIINELALRPHNSGHWTIEGAVTSQFEHILAASALLLVACFCPFVLFRYRALDRGGGVGGPQPALGGGRRRRHDADGRWPPGLRQHGALELERPRGLEREG